MANAKVEKDTTDTPLSLTDLMDQHQDRIDQNIHDAANNNDLASLGNGMVQHSLLQQLRDDQKSEAQPVEALPTEQRRLEPILGSALPPENKAPLGVIQVTSEGAPNQTSPRFVGPRLPAEIQSEDVQAPALFGTALSKAPSPFGSAVVTEQPSTATPVYTGPGAKYVKPGEAISPDNVAATNKAYDERIQSARNAGDEESADKLALAKMGYDKDHPWGSAENHPGFLGKLGHVLGRIGNIAGDVIAPRTMANIPGTELNRRVEANELQNHIKEDELATDRRAAQKAAVVGKTPEEQFMMDALHGGPNGTPTVDDQGNPYNYLTAHAAWVESGDVKAPKEETLDNMIAKRTQDVLSAKGDPSTDPTIKHLSEVKKGLVTGNLETKNVIGKDGKTYMHTFDPKTGTLGALLGEVKEPKETQPSTEQVGRTYDRYQSAAEKLSTPVDAALQRSALLVQNLDLKTKQADALIAPELLSIAAGGAGSGLRMNEAEISRVIGGRSAWDALVAKVNQVKEQGGTFDEAQRNQLKQIASYINNRNRAEASAIEQGKDEMLNATTENAVRKSYNDMKKKLTAVQRGDWITRAEADAMEKLQPGSSQALVKKGRVII